jgi:endoribonuclease Dicer
MELSQVEIGVSSESEQEEEKSVLNLSNATQRRKTHNAKFDCLYVPIAHAAIDLLKLTTLPSLSKEAASMTMEDLRSISQNGRLNQSSTTRLLLDQEFASVITDPREYQVELFERAKKENTIAVLDTGMP